MRCCDCKFHQSRHMWNRCDLMEEEYFPEHFSTPCYLINDDYIFIKDIPELGFEKGTSALWDMGDA